MSLNIVQKALVVKRGEGEREQKGEAVSPVKTVLGGRKTKQPSFLSRHYVLFRLKRFKFFIFLMSSLQTLVPCLVSVGFQAAIITFRYFNFQFLLNG